MIMLHLRKLKPRVHTQYLCSGRKWDSNTSSVVPEAALITLGLRMPTTGILCRKLGQEFGSEVPSSQGQEGKAFDDKRDFIHQQQQTYCSGERQPFVTLNLKKTHQQDTAFQTSMVNIPWVKVVKLPSIGTFVYKLHSCTDGIIHHVHCQHTEIEMEEDERKYKCTWKFCWGSSYTLSVRRQVPPEFPVQRVDPGNGKRWRTSCHHFSE